MSERKFNPFEVDVGLALAQLGIDAERRADTWVMRCPSGKHADRKPSFSVLDTPGEERHGCGYCFSCKFGTTMGQLVAHVVGITLQGAYGWLAERAMGRMLDVRRVTVELRAQGRVGMEVPKGVVIAPLDQWPTEPARFALARGIQSWQVDRWGLGYAEEGKLAHRLFIPAWGQDGELLNYTARTYAGSPCRYRSAERLEGPDVGAIFGEALWPAPANRFAVVVTEGALNALAVERAAHGTALASLFGSNVSLEHLCKLSTFKLVAILTDPDFAGDWAAEKLEGALARHVRTVRAKLPHKVDANDLERTDPAALKAIVEDAVRS